MKIKGQTNPILYFGVTFLLITCMLAWVSTGVLAKTFKMEVNPWIMTKWPVREAVKKFEACHPDIKVSIGQRGSTEMVSAYLLEWKRGNPAIDLAIGGGPAQMAGLVAANLMTDLSDMLTGKMAKENFIPALLKDVSFKKPDGTLCYPALPFTGEAMGVCINKSLYAQAGLLSQDSTPIAPNNWEEFEEQLRKLDNVTPTEPFCTPWQLVWVEYVYFGGVQAMRGDLWATEKHKSLDFSSKGAEKWLELNQRWVKEGLSSSLYTLVDANYGRNTYKAGKTAALYTSYPRFIEAAAVLGENNVSMVPLPGAKKNGSLVWAIECFIPKGASNPLSAKQFIREQLFSKWFQQWDWNRYGKLLALKQFYGEGLTWFRDEAADIVKMCEESVTIPKIRGDREMRDILAEEIAPLLQGKQTVKETMKNIQEKVKDRVDQTVL